MGVAGKTILAVFRAQEYRKAGAAFLWVQRVGDPYGFQIIGPEKPMVLYSHGARSFLNTTTVVTARVYFHHKYDSRQSLKHIHQTCVTTKNKKKKTPEINTLWE